MPHTAYKKELATDNYDIIFIGSGIGTLGAAAILAKQGKKCLILEKHYRAGGMTHTFTHKGYEWDVGIHYIGEVHREKTVLRKLFDYISDRNLKWAAMDDVYDKVIIGDREYNFRTGPENFKAELLKHFPAEEDAIDGYIKALYEVTRATRGFFTAKVMPEWMAKLSSPFVGTTFRKYADQTTREFLETLTQNEELIGVLTAQYGDYGLPPAESSFVIHAMVAKHYINGGAYPVGGSAELYNTISPVIEKAGGKILVKAGVNEILVSGNKAIGVELENGDQLFCDTIVSSAGVINTFKNLLPDSCPDKSKYVEKLTKVHPSLAHICLYVGMKEDGDSLGLPQHNFWIYPEANHDKAIEKYIADPTNDLPVTYISFPSQKDPAYKKNHPGKSTIEVISFTPYDWFKKWEGSKWMKRGEEYDAYKEQFAQRLLEKLYHYVPQVKGKIDHYEVSTPLTTRHFLNYEEGEIYGIEHTPQRFRQDWLRPKTTIKGLYLTGQDIVTDGIGGALFGGVLCASAISKQNVIMDIMKEEEKRQMTA